MRLIDADELTKALYVSLGVDRAYYDEKCDIDFDFVIKTINSQKTVESRPKGKWLRHSNGLIFKTEWGRCSECGNTLDFNGVNAGRGDANFCPNCGADMRGE